MKGGILKFHKRPLELVHHQRNPYLGPKELRSAVSNITCTFGTGKNTQLQGYLYPPSEKSTKSAATATADPLDDPPGTRVGAAGLTGVP